METNPIPTQQETLWLPIELAPKSETWLVVARIAEKEPNKGAVLWWYRAIFWRGRWRTSRDYSGSIEPSHFFNPERLNLGAAVAGPRVDRALYSELVHIAAELARGEGFLPTCAEDMNPRLKRADILKTAEAQEERLKDWANRVRQVADELSAATSSPTLAKSLLRDPVQARVLPTPFVTRDGVPCEDQIAALEEFKERCRAAAVDKGERPLTTSEATIMESDADMARDRPAPPERTEAAGEQED